jgi:hypothetical protein
VEIKSKRFFNRALIEKIILVSLLSIIFAYVLEAVKATHLQLVGGVAFIIVINSILSHWLARRGIEWKHILLQFIVMTVVNFGLVILYSFLLPRFDGSINLGNTLFFVLLLTLIVTLFDRYRQVYLRRFGLND